MDPVELAELSLSLAEVDPEKPSPARIYDFWLGGSQNFAADREVARRTAEAMPHVPAAAWANRAFLRRVVHHLVAEQGITQLLDLGSGVPTVGNVHEVAQQANPDARVVYVDIDPVAVAHARALLDGTPGVVPILADMRQPETVLSHPLLHDTLDLTRPVAVLMFAVLHFIDDEQASAVVHAFMDAVTDGSFLAISHGIPDRVAPETGSAMARDYAANTGVSYYSRTPQQIAAWLTGLQIQPPGVVPIDQWRPDPGTEPRANPLACGVLALKNGEPDRPE
jgi:O-methyltransferase involved in polyketide biosynthesis